MCKYTLFYLCCQDIFYKKLDFCCKIFVNVKNSAIADAILAFFGKNRDLKSLQQRFNAVGENLVVVVVILLTRGSFCLF